MRYIIKWKGVTKRQREGKGGKNGGREREREREGERGREREVEKDRWEKDGGQTREINNHVNI